VRAIFLALLLAGVRVVAQEFPLRSPATQDPAANSSSPRQYQGCVRRLNRGILLADQPNHNFMLVGDRKLDSYVGQEVRIIAHDVNPNDPSSAERSMSDGEPLNQPVTLYVEEIQRVSDTCSPPK
jgi:hypothetical protein